MICRQFFIFCICPGLFLCGTTRAQPVPPANAPVVASVDKVPLAPTPAPPKISYSEVNVDGPYIAMTFDDGPHVTNTPRLLDILAKRHIKATFFVVGENVVQYPAIMKRIVSEGHEIANHSWSHPDFSKMSEERVRGELQRTQDAILQTAGVQAKLLRPPYGAFTPKQRQWAHTEFGFKIILWSVDPLDWKKPGPGMVTQRILSETRPGAIILSHDIHPQTIEAMPATFDALLAKGYKFVTVSELLSMEKPSHKAAAPEPHGMGEASAVQKTENKQPAEVPSIAASVGR